MWWKRWGFLDCFGLESHPDSGVLLGMKGECVVGETNCPVKNYDHVLQAPEQLGHLGCVVYVWGLRGVYVV